MPLCEYACACVCLLVYVHNRGLLLELYMYMRGSTGMDFKPLSIGLFQVGYMTF